MRKVVRFVLVAAATLVTTACIPKSGDLEVECPVIPGVYRATKYIDGEGHTGIIGQVYLKEGKAPIDRAYVNIYQDTISNLLGPSQFMSRPTDSEGRYAVDLPPGTYYIVARKRMTGDPTGPISTGDYYSEHQRIVTQVIEGKRSVVDLPVVAMKAPMFFKKEVVDKETKTGIRGRLLDASGKPVPGGFAMAFLDADVKRLPDYASTLTDENGEFTIYLPSGGSFYLAGRIQAWDMPLPGEPYGKLDTPVEVKNDSFVDNIEIQLSPFTGEYKQGKSRRPY